MSSIPRGLNYVNVRRRAGVLSDYNIVLLNTVVLSDFYLIDEFVQAQVKNFGQLDVRYSSEVYILELLESKDSFEECTYFELTPIYVNDVPYTGDTIKIYFSEIVGILKNGDNSDIYSTSDVIKKQNPVKYTVGYSVSELWGYIKTCSF